MQTTTAKKPDALTPETPGSAWVAKMLRLQRRYTRPAEVFEIETGRNATVRDLLAVQHAVDPPSREPGNLLRTSQLLPIQFHHQGGGSDIQMLEPDYGQLADNLSSRLASDARRAEVADALFNVLQLGDQAIINEHGGGRRHPAILSTPDFDAEPVWIESPSGASRTYWVGVLPDDLPADHIVRSWPPEILYRAGSHRRPAVVLGLGHPNRPNSPRGFYATARAATLTVQARTYQLRRLMDRGQLPPQEYTRVYTDLARCEELAPTLTQRAAQQAAMPDVVPPPQQPWAIAVLEAIECWSRPSAYFTGPPPGTTLAELLTVRSSFGVLDETDDPIKAAAVEFAARVAGGHRREELRDLLRGFMTTLRRSLVRKLEAGIVWSAVQAAGEQ